MHNYVMISCITNFLIDWYKRFRNSIGIFNALTAWMWITWNDVNILILLSEISTEYFQSVPVVAIVVDVLTIKLYNIVFKGAVANFTNGPFRLPPSGPGWGRGGGSSYGFQVLCQTLRMADWSWWTNTTLHDRRIGSFSHVSAKMSLPGILLISSQRSSS